MNAVEALDNSSVRTVEGWAATVRACWAHCCRHDKIDPAAPVVAFSEGNPFVKWYERAQDKYKEALAGSTALGYTGLVIGKAGRAEIAKPVKKTNRRTGTNGLPSR